MKTLTRSTLTLLAAISVAACAPARPYYQESAYQQPEPFEVSGDVYLYPNNGQSLARQDRDRYECYLWARQQTGFEPSELPPTVVRRTDVAPQPAPGEHTLVGAFTGAALGAMIGAPHRPGEGAIIGALAGAMMGAASDTARQEQAALSEGRYRQQTMSRYASRSGQARNYQRALGACLEGRGYTVR